MDAWNSLSVLFPANLEYPGVIDDFGREIGLVLIVNQRISTQNVKRRLGYHETLLAWADHDLSTEDQIERIWLNSSCVENRVEHIETILVSLKQVCFFFDLPILIGNDIFCAFIECACRLEVFHLNLRLAIDQKLDILGISLWDFSGRWGNEFVLRFWEIGSHWVAIDARLVDLSRHRLSDACFFEQGQLICLVGEWARVRLDVQHFCVKDKILQYAMTKPVGEKWWHISAKVLLDSFELVFLQIFTSLPIHKKGDKLFFLKASFFPAFSFELIFNLCI